MGRRTSSSSSVDSDSVDDAAAGGGTLFPCCGYCPGWSCAIGIGRADADSVEPEEPEWRDCEKDPIAVMRPHA